MNGKNKSGFSHVGFQDVSQIVAKTRNNQIATERRSLSRGFYKSQKKPKKSEKKISVERVKKLFVLDTNVFMHHPESLFVFEENDIVITSTVLEEADGLKSRFGELGYLARSFSRILESIRSDHIGKIEIKIGEGLGNAVFVIDSIDYCKSLGLNPEKKDNLIISTAYRMKVLNKDREVIFVSRDSNAKTTASCFLSIKTEDYENDKTTTFTMFGNIFGKNDSSSKEIKSVQYQVKDERNFYKIINGNKVETPRRKSIGEIHCKNIEQEAFLTALVDPEIKVIAVSGIAGTGKTMLALLAGFHQILGNEKKYEKIIATRAIIPVDDKDIGYLPGDIDSKFSPWMKPIESALEIIKKSIIIDAKSSSGKKTISDQNFDKNIKDSLLLEPITYMRGVSIPNSFIIIDEAQNCTPQVMKTILTRVGDGSKVVVCFDPEQIDNKYLDQFSNGGSYLVDRFISTEEYFCYIKMQESVRSEIAKRSAELL